MGSVDLNRRLLVIWSHLLWHATCSVSFVTSRGSNLLSLKSLLLSHRLLGLKFSVLVRDSWELLPLLARSFYGVN